MVPKNVSMKRTTLVAILVSVALLCVTAWTITLHLGGYTTEAISFAKWAYGGIATLVIIVWIFGGLFGSLD
jgi:hypothetical protein